MTKVSFYVLGDGADAGARLILACRLAEKAMRQDTSGKAHTYLQCDSEADVGRIDDLLWTFRQGSFVAHERLAELRDINDAAPVVIGSGEPPAELDGVLINLADEVPAWFSRFERVLEIIEPATRDAGRKRYQFYKDRGYPLETHKLEAEQAS